MSSRMKTIGGLDALRNLVETQPAVQAAEKHIVALAVEIALHEKKIFDLTLARDRAYGRKSALGAKTFLDPFSGKIRKIDEAVAGFNLAITHNNKRVRFLRQERAQMVISSLGRGAVSSALKGVKGQ